MAAMIVCDSCGAVVHYTEAMHVRFHTLMDAENYSTSTVLYGDVCRECYKKMTAMLKHEEADK